jgi:glutathione S-transferase
MKPILFYAPGACSLASHIALVEAGADFELRLVRLAKAEQRTPDYLQVNPKGRVPALVTERGVLTENPAILAYVAQNWPETGLGPIGDPWAMAEVNAFNSFLCSSVHVAFAHIFRPGRYADGDAAARAMREKSPQSLDDFFVLIEAKLEAGLWIHGDSFSVSDPYLYLFSRWFQRDGMGHPERFPRVRAHMERVHARPATQNALAAEALTGN